MKIKIFLIAFLLISSNYLGAQCTSFISSFPYTENFETGTNGWASGGINNSWAWGTPAKSYILNAGSGTKCWVTGGLIGSVYNNGERSFVTSPCFDFTSITNPYFTAKIWWESEHNYDGTTFQYSTNNGATWTNVGSSADPVNCLNENWFNTPNITYLTGLANPKDGWSGSIFNSTTCPSNSGSGAWLTAKHCMANLAGLPSVQFRFAFGAGTFCNGFDGFAFDDIYIGEAPPNNASFTFNCTGNALEYQFNNTSTPCPSGFSWTFGDPTSGTSNSSILPNPTHTFTAAGTYNVTLTAFGPCNGTSVISQSIITINSNLTATSPLCFNSPTGSITTSTSNNSGAVSYLLLPNNVSNLTGNFSNLTTGSYTVKATDASNCAVTKSININNANPLSWSSFSTQNISCFGLTNGSIIANAIGGTNTFSYLLQPGNVANSTGIYSNLSNGNYTIQATDANGCTLSSVVFITQPNQLNFQNLTISNVQCNGQNNGSINATMQGGTGNFQFQLQPNNVNNTTGLFQNLSSGIYTVLATDANNCTLTTIATITAPNPINYLNSSIVDPWCNPNNNGSIQINANGGSGLLTYAINGSFSPNSSFTNLVAGTYTVTIKDANNCSISTTINLSSPQPPTFNNTSIINVNCNGETNGKIDISATGTNPILNYNLMPGAINMNNGNFNNLGANTYTITATDDHGCSVSKVEQISQPELLKIEQIFIANLDSCSDNFKANIEVINSGGSTPIIYRVLPGGITNNIGKFKGLNIGNYTITITDAHNCTTSSSFAIKEQICCGNVFIPSAFSPNKDGKNDELKLLNDQGIIIKDFSIYNRYGNLIFKSQNAFDSWDGKFKGLESEIGTYYYQVKYTCTASKKEYYLKGDITLIR